MARDVEVAVTVPGLRRLGRDLRKLGEDTADLKDASKKASELVAREARANITNRSGRSTGRLASTGRGSRAAGRATVVFGGARAEYAAVHHYGWETRGIPANEYAWQAAVDTRPEWLALYQAGVEDALARLDNQTY